MKENASSKLVARLVTAQDGDALFDYHRENEAHQQPWAPLREPGWHSRPNWQKRAEAWAIDYRLGRGATFIGSFPGESTVVALATLSQILRGAFQACYLGYSIDSNHEGRGLMPGFLQQVLDHAFNELGLNRVMANYMPNNSRSQRLLLQLGFEREGYAKRYLKINGRWEDHVLMAKVSAAE